jgi:hypothetical protein
MAPYPLQSKGTVSSRISLFFQNGYSVYVCGSWRCLNFPDDNSIWWWDSMSIRSNIVCKHSIDCWISNINILQFHRIMMIASLFIQMRHCPVVVFFSCQFTRILFFFFLVYPAGNQQSLHEMWCIYEQQQKRECRGISIAWWYVYTRRGRDRSTNGDVGGERPIDQSFWVSCTSNDASKLLTADCWAI